MRPISAADRADLRRQGIDLDAGAIQTRRMSPTEAERADLVICGGPPAEFPDEDVLAWCADCGTAIVHRPHAPRAPVKVCVPCGWARLQRPRGHCRR